MGDPPTKKGDNSTQLELLRLNDCLVLLLLLVVMVMLLVVTLWDYEPNWLIVRLIVQTYVGIVLLSILSAPFSPPKKIIQNWLTNTYHGILKPYYDVSQMIYGIYASWICSSDSGLGFQSLGQVKGNGKCDPPLT